MDCAQWIGSSLVACLLLGGGVAVAQTPAPPPPPSVPALAAELETCQRSALPAQRVASFVGSMPARAGADRMQMRFDLQRRKLGERRWRTVRGAQGFGVWETAEPGRAGFVFHKRVDGLQVPASYRALVRFRWTQSDGTIVKRARRRTAVCGQPDLRPDLVAVSLRGVLDVSIVPAVYRLVVRNDGRSAAGPFAVRVAGSLSEVAGLAAGERTVVTVVGTPCAAGTTVRALVDADFRIDESDEHNGLRRQCPLALVSGSRAAQTGR